MVKLFFFLSIMSSPLLALPGVYVGGEIGGHLVEATQNGSFNENIAVSFNIFYSALFDKKMYHINPSGRFFVGLERHRGLFYLAAEGSLQCGTAYLESNQINSSLQAFIGRVFNRSSSTNSKLHSLQCALDFLPGISLGPNTLLHGRIGVGYAQIKTTMKGVNDTNILPFPTLIDQTLEKKNAATLRLGMGIKHQLTERIAFRANYIYTDFGHQFLEASANTSLGPNDNIFVTTKNKLHFYEHAALLGLSYHFCPSPCSYEWGAPFYRGFYAGAAWGGNILTARSLGQVIGDLSQGVNFKLTTSYPSRLFKNNFIGLACLGYATHWKRIYLGGEFFLTTLPNHRLQVHGRSTLLFASPFVLTYDLSMLVSSLQGGLDLRPGILVTPRLLINGRLGVVATKIKLESEVRTSDIFTQENVSKSKNKAALRLGIGLEHALSRQLHLRADFIHTHYGSVSFDHRIVINQLRSITNTLSTRLYDNALLIGLSYYFCR